MAKPEEFFRRLYREPLARTRNKTIRYHDRAKKAARTGGLRYDGERAREMQKKSMAVKLATYTEHDWKLQIAKAIKASADARRGTRAASEASSRASKKLWAGKTQEEKNEMAARARRGRWKAPWPFPFRPRSHGPEEQRAARSKNLKKARVALNAKRLRAAMKKKRAAVSGRPGARP